MMSPDEDQTGESHPKQPDLTLNAGRDLEVGGDVVGGDKVLGDKLVAGRDIIQRIDQLVQLSRTAAEEAEAQQAWSRKLLGEAVQQYAASLKSQAAAQQRTNPYKGLQAYQLSDYSLYAGRETAVSDMLALLSGNQRLTILHGRSGTGKSSLIQAGLFPHLLADGHLPLRVRTWQGNPVLSLKSSLLPNVNAAPQLAEMSLQGFLRALGEILPDTRRIYIFFDQFEEFFRQNPDREARRPFVNELSAALDDLVLPVHFILALRDEQFGLISTFQPPINQPFAGQYLLEKLTRAEAERALARPAAVYGVDFHADVITAVLDALEADGIAPPELQIVCETLYRQRTAGQAITLEVYRRLKETRGILQNYLNRVVTQELPPEQRAVAGEILQNLVTAQGHRAQKSEGELCGMLAGPQRATCTATLLTLYNRRLLQTVDAPETRYELVHDYLLDEIKLWIDEQRLQAKQIQEMLAYEQIQHADHGRTLDADQLELVAQQLDNPHLHLATETRRFLLLSAVARDAPAGPWLALAGESCAKWLRDMSRDDTQPRSLHLNAYAHLGHLQDDTTLRALLEEAAKAETRSARRQTAAALARFLYRDARPHQLPLVLRPAVFWHTLRLHTQASHTYRKRVRQTALFLALACVLVTGSVSYFNQLADAGFEGNFQDALLNTGTLLLIFLPIGGLLAYLYSETVTRLALATRRLAIGWQLLTLALAGGLVGLLLFLMVSLEPFGWAAGALLGAAVALLPRLPRGKWGLWLKLAAVLVGVLAISATAGVQIWRGKSDWQYTAPKIVMVGVFAAVFAYVAARYAPTREISRRSNP